jgi:hypothetical protein
MKVMEEKPLFLWMCANKCPKLNYLLQKQKQEEKKAMKISIYYNWNLEIEILIFDHLLIFVFWVIRGI